jgi:glutathione S-transferase
LFGISRPQANLRADKALCLRRACALTTAAIAHRLPQALTIYGSPRSRTMRTLWLAAELGLDYRHVPLAYDDPQLKQPDFLAINPAGTIPAIVDDGFALAESLAINLYLAKKFGSTGPSPLYPTSVVNEAEVWRWTLWAQAHLEPWVQRDALLLELREAVGRQADKVVGNALTLLNAFVATRPWLVGGAFTVADLNVACVLSPSRAAHLDLHPFANVESWLARCYARPAAVAVRTRFAA